MENNELYHHGVKGMQWGKRLYQNKDGSLTALGRARYAIKKSRSDAKRKEMLNIKRKTAIAEQKALQAKYKKEAKDLKKASKPTDTKKKASEMSDDELKRAIERARLEDTYKQLRPEETKKKGAGLIKSLLGNVVAPAAQNAGRQVLEEALKKYGGDLIKDAVDPKSIAGLTQTRDKLKLKKEIEDLKKNKEPELSWADKLKKQTWEKNERERQEAERAKTEESKSGTKNSANATDYSSYDPASSAPNRSSSKSSPLVGDIIGEGTSRRSSSDSGTSSARSKGETFWTTDYRDTSASSVTSMVPSQRTTNFISGLLEPPRD